MIGDPGVHKRGGGNGGVTAQLGTAIAVDVSGGVSIFKNFRRLRHEDIFLVGQRGRGRKKQDVRVQKRFKSIKNFAEKRSSSICGSCGGRRENFEGHSGRKSDHTGQWRKGR